MAVKHGDCRIGELLDSHKTQAQIFGCHSMKSYLMRSQQSTTRVVHHMSEAGLPSTTPVHHAVHHACQQVREARRFYRTCFSCRGVHVNLSSIALLQFPSKDVLSQLQTMEFNWVNYHRGDRKILKTEDDYFYQKAGIAGLVNCLTRTRPNTRAKLEFWVFAARKVI